MSREGEERQAYSSHTAQRQDAATGLGTIVNTRLVSREMRRPTRLGGLMHRGMNDASFGLASPIRLEQLRKGLGLVPQDAGCPLKFLVQDAARLAIDGPSEIMRRLKWILHDVINKVSSETLSDRPAIFFSEAYRRNMSCRQCRRWLLGPLMSCLLIDMIERSCMEAS